MAQMAAPGSRHSFMLRGHWPSGGSEPEAEESNQQRLEQLRGGVARGVEQATRLELDEKRAEAAKIQRFLGLSKDAGMPDAIRWANSTDPEERALAARVLREIGTSEARTYEETLSRDADPGVAKEAREKFKWWGKVDPYYPDAFDRQTPGT